MSEKKLVLEIGTTCNNNCIFCCDDKIKNLTKQQIESIIINEKNNYSAIEFAQKEPSLNPHLFHYSKLAKQNKYKRIMIATNGRMFSILTFAQKAIKHGINCFYISIHGATPTTHDSLTKTKNSFKQTLQGIKNLSQLKETINPQIEINIAIVLTKQNLNEIKNTIETLNELKINNILIHIVEHSGLAKKHYHQLMPNYQEIINYLKKNKKTFLAKNIQIKYLPKCLRYELYQEYNTYTKEYIERRKQVKEEIKQKGEYCLDEKCKTCKDYKICIGLPKEYIKLYSWGAFKPL